MALIERSYDTNRMFAKLVELTNYDFTAHHFTDDEDDTMQYKETDYPTGDFIITMRISHLPDDVTEAILRAGLTR